MNTYEGKQAISPFCSQSQEPRKSFRVGEQVRKSEDWSQERRGIITNRLQVHASQHCTGVSIWDNASKSKASNTGKVQMIKVTKNGFKLLGFKKYIVDQMKKF